MVDFSFVAFFRLPVYLVALALCALSAVALADPPPQCPNPLYATTWTGAVDNNWFNTSNWTNQVPTCGPDVSYDAFIPNGTPQISTGAASACAVSLAQDTTTESASLSVDGSGTSLTVCTNIFVGYQGKGYLAVTNGGVVTTITASIASVSGSNGRATVDGTHSGTNSTWAVADKLDVAGLQSASGGTGLLTVTNSGTVTAGSVHVWKSGTLTGNGTVTTTNGTTTIEGTLAPSAGTFTFNGDVSWLSNAVTECNFSPSSLVNKLEISGRATVDGRLSVTVAADTPPGRYTLLHTSNLQNSFSSYSIKVPGCLGWSIVYDHDNGYAYLDLAVICN
jgi:T5SS/PEP-CTERM-associated repeat protein